MTDEALRIEATGIAQRRYTSTGVFTNIAGAPKPIEEFLKDCEVVFQWLRHGNQPAEGVQNDSR